MTQKIVEATEVQFEDIKPVDIPIVGEPKIVPTEKPAAAPDIKQSQNQSQEEPITLHDLIIYDTFGALRRKYETVTLYPAPIDKIEMHFLTFSEAYEAMAKKEGKEVPSLPILYAIIEKLHTEKHPAEAGLLAELKKYSFCTSTLLNYKTYMMTHGSNFPSQYILAEPFPDSYWSGSINKKNITWRWFMRALLQPHDVDQAIELLQEFGGHPLSVIIPDPNKYDGGKNFDRVPASLFLSEDTTYLNCMVNPNKLTYSRLVTLK